MKKFKYLIDIIMVFVVLNFHRLMVDDICVLDHMIILFICGILKHISHFMFSMDTQKAFGVNNNKNDINNKMNNIGVIGGNGYTICSGSWDKTIRIWDIETIKGLLVFKGHEDWINSVKYGSNELGINGGANTILSGSDDYNVRLWDIRSGQQIQVFNGHESYVNIVEYSPFVVNNIEFGGSSNVICSGSNDNTIRFWDIRSNKNQLYMIKGDGEKDNGIIYLKYLSLKKKEKNNRKTNNYYSINLCYSSKKGSIGIWG
ncbi:G-protein beta WD-40 repeats containing protein [Reticulomyxa filosa]|uniref:G-protein beta WD-40 repeats containing protein n=1 Tax=Reticulomyxa filosa TaxID=46433 RepID=X6M5I8_RETFI|nr:G-protein beta WD-40 repeats containing protein [Reticulomyxa filosa]|eukprot:ETO08737.1 G-protein beta WD-40 repeats containing protein [Reticulomyxa filosa]